MLKLKALLVVPVILVGTCAALSVFIGGAVEGYSTGKTSANGLEPSSVSTTEIPYFNRTNWGATKVFKYSYNHTVHDTLRKFEVECFCSGIGFYNETTVGNCVCDKPSSHLDNYLSNFDALFSHYPKTRYTLDKCSSPAKLLINGSYDPSDDKVDISAGDNDNDNDNGAGSPSWSICVLAVALLSSSVLLLL